MTDMTPTVVTVSTTSGSGGSGLVEPGKRPIFIKAVTPLVIIAVRAARVFLQTLLGLATAGMVAPNVLRATDFLDLLATCASLSLAPAAVCIIQNMIELLTKADQQLPTLTV